MMNFDIKNPPDSQPDEAEAIAEQAGMNWELVKPLMKSRQVNKVEEPPQLTVSPSPASPSPQIKTKLQSIYSLRRTRRSTRTAKRTLEKTANPSGTPSAVSTARRSSIWTNKKLKSDCFRQKNFALVVFDKYHENAMPEDEYAIKILDLSKTAQPSQLDKFCFDERQFIIITWLSAVRIFEFDSKLNRYFEVRRMPQRYIGFSSDLITSVHYRDAKLYIAYIASESSYKTSKLDDTSAHQAYIEIRNLHGRLLEGPFRYTDVIKSIHSNQDFIYVKTTRNVIFIHKRTHFSFNPYRIDMSLTTSDPIIKIEAQSNVSCYDQFKLLTATPRYLLISKQDGLQNTLCQSYDFDFQNDCKYQTVAMHHHRNSIILLRSVAEDGSSNQFPSKLEFGSLRKFSHKRGKSYDEYFVHERSMSFRYHILQMELSLDLESIFLFGRARNSAGQYVYELGQMRLIDLKPIWCSRVYKVNDDTKFIVQKDNLAIIQDSQNHYVISLNLSTVTHVECELCRVMHSNLMHTGHEEHPGIFRNSSIKFNASLMPPSESQDKANQTVSWDALELEYEKPISPPLLNEKSYFFY